MKKIQWWLAGILTAVLIFAMTCVIDLLGRSEIHYDYNACPAILGGAIASVWVSKRGS